jgi:hypothetical protein
MFQILATIKSTSSTSTNDITTISGRRVIKKYNEVHLHEVPPGWCQLTHFTTLNSHVLSVLSHLAEHLNKVYFTINGQ